MPRSAKRAIESATASGLELAVPNLPGRSLQLLHLADLSRYVDREALLREDDMAEPPYWAHLWPAARALARMVAAAAAEIRGRLVVELGCGLGLPGLAAARCGARVVLSDRSLEALAFAKRNLQHNGLTGEVIAMDWRHDALRSPFGICLAADVTYEPISHPGLIEFARLHMAADGELWIAESVRAEERALPDRLAGVFAVDECRVAEMEEGRPVWVRLLRARWRR
jgi:predicted nicotinamide N-methyase